MLESPKLRELRQALLQSHRLSSPTAGEASAADTLVGGVTGEAGAGRNAVRSAVRELVERGRAPCPPATPMAA
jgi:hypothetical protein